MGKINDERCTALLPDALAVFFLSSQMGLVLS